MLNFLINIMKLFVNSNLFRFFGFYVMALGFLICVVAIIRRIIKIV